MLINMIATTIRLGTTDNSIVSVGSIISLLALKCRKELKLRY